MKLLERIAALIIVIAVIYFGEALLHAWSSGAIERAIR